MTAHSRGYFAAQSCSVCVCVSVCAHMHLHVCMSACTRACACMYTHVHACMCVCMCVRACVCVHACACMCVCVCVRVHLYISSVITKPIMHKNKMGRVWCVFSTFEPQQHSLSAEQCTHTIMMTVICGQSTQDLFRVSLS